MDRATADYMGMLATVMNAMALADAFRAGGVNARVQSALRIDQVVEPHIRGKAIRYLEEGARRRLRCRHRQPLLHHRHRGCALRGAEIGADIVLKATKVDGIYTADPKKDPSATRFSGSLRRGDRPQSRGDGRHRVCPVPRPAPADQRVQPVQGGALKRVVMGEDEGTLVYC